MAEKNGKKRRIKGEGGIYERKDGRWAGQYEVETATGTKRRYVYGKTKTETARKLREAVAERESGFAFEAGKVTVGEYLSRWLQDSVRGTVKVSTLEKHEIMVRVHLAPAVGTKKLGALRPVHLQRLYRQKLDSGLSPASIKSIHGTLNKALKQAVRWGIVPRNVCEAVSLPRGEGEEIRPLTPVQARRLLEEATGHHHEALYVLALTTGLRLGELLALRWEDADLGRGVLSVNRTLSRIEDGKWSFDRPKTARSRRTVGMTPEAVRSLVEHRERGGGADGSDGLIFRTRTGGPLNPSNVRNRSLRPLLGRAGIPEIRFHDLRHTCATLLLTEGVHPKIVQEMLGHSSITITLDTYSHVLPNMQGRAVEAMNSLFRRGPQDE